MSWLGDGNTSFGEGKIVLAWRGEDSPGLEVVRRSQRVLQAARGQRGVASRNLSQFCVFGKAAAGDSSCYRERECLFYNVWNDVY